MRYNNQIKVKEEIIEEGWVGKPKGSLQVLFKRGWIDPNEIHNYTKKGKVEKESVAAGSNLCRGHDADDDKQYNATNFTFENHYQYNLSHLMNVQQDFLNEITLLQYHANRMGVSLDRSPKCHPELAGEGIEYLWAIAKIYYRKTDINKKRSKSLFHSLVSSVTDPKTVLSINRVRGSSKKARDYMILYHVFDNIDLVDHTLTLKKHSIMEGSIDLYNKMKKKCKSHRSVLDMDESGINELINKFSITSAADETTLIKIIAKKMHCFKQESE